MFEQLVDKLPVGIGIVDESFNVVYLNEFFWIGYHKICVTILNRNP